ncbi:uncharacterized protein LOC142233295 [Haematobia irritans]|uniref:uncharacterized protein LOC142233295 n=1 Tax=Haematobia irritans TaxID=7368 RepID=UPI003F4F6BAC
MSAEDPGDPPLANRPAGRPGVKSVAKRNSSLVRTTDKMKERRIEGCATVRNDSAGAILKASGEATIHNKTSAVNSKEPQNNYCYDDSHPGPYMVYVDVISSGDIRQPISLVGLARKIRRLEIPDIDAVTKMGYGRGKVTFKNATAANNFANDCRMPASGYQPKIFSHFVSRMGVVYPVDTDISEEEISKMFRSEETDILKIFRVKRKEGDEFFPTKRVKILFKGLVLPEYVLAYNYARIKVMPHIPFSQCFRCYRFNHFAKHCKQTASLCRTCFTGHLFGENCPTGNVTCTNCKGNHNPTDRNCPARAKAYNIRRTMTVENLSLSETKTKYPTIFSNRFYLLDDDIDQSFPSLPKRATREPINVAAQ